MRSTPYLLLAPTTLTPTTTNREEKEVGWLPFGGGARYCLGAKLGMDEARIVVARVIQRFELLPPISGPIRSRLAFTLRPHTILSHTRSTAGL